VRVKLCHLLRICVGGGFHRNATKTWGIIPSINRQKKRGCLMHLSLSFVPNKVLNKAKDTASPLSHQVMASSNKFNFTQAFAPERTQKT